MLLLCHLNRSDKGFSFPLLFKWCESEIRFHDTTYLSQISPNTFPFLHIFFQKRVQLFKLPLTPSSKPSLFGQYISFFPHLFTSWAKLWSFFWGFLSNLQISTVLTIFLDRFDGLLLKWDIIIFFSGISSGFRIISGFFRILFKSMCGDYICKKHMVRQF